jgi:WD40 repeat protein/serine/threonine protein kinase
VAAALQDFLAALEAGERPDRQTLLERFPLAAPLLSSCIDALEAIHSFAPHVRREHVTIQDEPDTSPSLHGPGVPLGDFRILRELGRGGMGIVYEAEQISLGRRVALKILPFAAMLDERQLRRFKNEAQAAAMLKHPNIVSVHGIGCERGIHYFAMELVEGQTLAEVIDELRQSRDKGQETRAGKEPVVSRQSSVAQSRPATDDEQPTTDSSCSSCKSQIPHSKSQIDTEPLAALATEYSQHPQQFFRTVARLGIQAAQALHNAHQEGVVHRDVKPSNLLVNREGKLSVADFGLAQIHGAAELTITGDVVGTLRYMSPEQLAGGRVVDQRTDIYSLGLTLYELVTGRPAFDEEDRERLVHAVLTNQPRRPSELRPAIPYDLETILLRATAKDREARYAAAHELAADLQRFLDRRPIQARRTSFLARTRYWARRNPVVATLTAVLFFVLTFLSVAGPMAAYRQAQSANEAQRNIYVADVQRAYQEWYSGNVEYATQLLERHVPDDGRFDPRGFEWHYLWNLVEKSRNTILYRHEGGVNAIAVSPDGKLLASGGDDRVIRLWSIADRTIREFRGHTDVIRSIEFEPSGQRFVSASTDRTARFWDVKSGQPTGSVLAHDDAVRKVAVSRDGQLIATGTLLGELLLWTPDGMLKNHWPAGQASTILTGREIWGLDFSPNGERLAFAAWNDGAGTIDLATYEISMIAASKGWLFDVLFSADGKRLFTGSSEGLSFCDWASGEEIVFFREMTDPVASLCLSHDALLASGGFNGITKIWDAKKGRLLESLIGHFDSVSSVCFSLDGRRLFTGGADGTVRQWDMDPVLRGKRRQTDADERWPTTIAVAPDGSKVFAITRHVGPPRTSSPLLFVYDPASDEPVASLELPASLASDLFSIDIAPDGKSFATSGRGHVMVWDCDTLSPLRTLRAAPQWTFSNVRFSPDGQLLGAVACSVDESHVVLWEIPGWKESKLAMPLRLSGLVRIAFSPASDRLAVSGRIEEDQGAILVWQQGQTGFQLHQSWDYSNEWELIVLEFTRDARSLIAAGYRGIRVFDLQTKRMHHLPRISSTDVMAMALPPEGNMVAAAGYGFVKLIDLATGDAAATIRIPTWSASMKFLPDGKTLAVGGGDGNVYFFRAHD